LASGLGECNSVATSLHEKYRSLSMKNRIFKTISRLFWDDCGATVIEYAVMASLISVAVIASVGQIASQMKDSFNSSGKAVNQSLSP
jgi:Flp pilus assembly pilin Flp